MASEPPTSYYAVFDGHAGKDAAAFASSHLHTVRSSVSGTKFGAKFKFNFSFSASSAT